MEETYILKDELSYLPKESIIQLLNHSHDKHMAIRDKVEEIFLSMTQGRIERSSLSTTEMLTIISTLLGRL
ncbi:hypothetical protein [Sphingobacterium thalpophilum]|uniref:hypothetical protein n=1 Tax=Sphingobacterium thalpophilum TaxID=259 RepID=UPI0024A740DA|nr:hypothetical protein [Sphingobacterium thalpophilum]